MDRRFRLNALEGDAIAVLKYFFTWDFIGNNLAKNTGFHIGIVPS
jgi:hypothetical protein